MSDKPVLFGVVRREYYVVNSTQNVAREWVERDGEKVAGAVVTARSMTAGRGRLGRTWHVLTGRNVCLTAIGPPVDSADAWQIAFLGGIAVAEAVADIAEFTTNVRFPNDVYRNGRKVSGILIETISGPLPGKVTPLIGIGINVNVAASEFPIELQERATSLQSEMGKTCNVAEVTNAVLHRLSEVWNLWQSEGFAAVLTRWRELTDKDARRTFLVNGEEVSCRIANVAVNGDITLETPTGETAVMPASHIVFGSD